MKKFTKHLKMKSCQECGKEFESKNNARFCSFKCSSSHMARHKHLKIREEHKDEYQEIASRILPDKNQTKWKIKNNVFYKNDDDLKGNIFTCKQCGRKFYSYDKSSRRGTPTFCSPECYHLSKHKFITKSCLNCGNDFSVDKNKASYQQFCSDNCELMFINDLNNGKKTYPHDYHQLTCINCNKPFYDFEEHSEFYCSYKCEKEFRNKSNLKKVICKNCGKEFFTYQNATFCSTSCGSQYNAKKNGFGSKIRPETSWNTGLTKYTDERIMKSAIKESISQHKSFKSGKRKSNSKFLHGYFKLFTHYIRSSWEFNFALILQYCNRKYSYEKKTFFFKDGSGYTPDFYDIERNIVYEIKGYFYKDFLETLEKMKKEYPQVKLHLIAEKQYRQIYEHFKFKLKLIDSHMGKNNRKAMFYTNEEIEVLRVDENTFKKNYSNENSSYKNKPYKSKH